jgi:hypothetical protein
LHAGPRLLSDVAGAAGVDPTLVECHSEKELAAPNFKGGFGFHPILVWLDNTNEALAGLLRPGNAGANTATDRPAVAARPARPLLQ